MSKLIDSTSFIFEESDRRCAYCGKYDECKPYGLHGEQICYQCARKDARTTERMMREKLFGELKRGN